MEYILAAAFVGGFIVDIQQGFKAVAAWKLLRVRLLNGLSDEATQREVLQFLTSGFFRRNGSRSMLHQDLLSSEGQARSVLDAFMEGFESDEVLVSRHIVTEAYQMALAGLQADRENPASREFVLAVGRAGQRVVPAKYKKLYREARLLNDIATLSA